MVIILLSAKVDFTVKNITRNKKGHFSMTKQSFIKRYIVILNVYSPTKSASKHMKRKPIELQGEIEKPIIGVRDSDILLIVSYRTNR